MAIILCSNRKAHHEYEILDKVEAGIVLIGSEVKSLRDRKASLDGAYAIVEDNEVWLINSHIDEYKNANSLFAHAPRRKRKLLLSRSQIKKFAEKASVKGFTLIPLTFQLTNVVRNSRVKVELAVCRGKQLHDKRAAAKERDLKREIRQGE